MNSLALNNNDTRIGCSVEQFGWCVSLRHVPAWLYYPALVIGMGFFSQILGVVLNTLYSLIIGPRPQGTHQGVLMMAAASARLVGPVLIRFRK